MLAPSRVCSGVISGLFTLILPAAANTLLMRGKVVMEDGSPPGKTIGIERFCADTGAQREAQATKQGDFLWTMQVDPLSNRACVLRATLVGYESSVINISAFNWSIDPNLPPLVLRPRAAGSSNEDANIFFQEGVPLAARNAWNNAQKLTQKGSWAAAEHELKAALQVAPKFTRGWNALGVAYANQNKPAEARDAFQKVVELDPKSLDAYLNVARESIAAKDWSTADKIAAALIKEDTKQRYPEIYLHQAMARYYLRDLDGAETSARTCIRLDKRREVPRAEYILGVILEGKKDYTQAREHLTQYLALDSKAADADAIRKHLDDLGKPRDPSLEAALPTEPLVVPTTASSSGVGEAWVPGGMKALAAIVHLDTPVTYYGFYSSYCRTILREVTMGGSGIPQFLRMVRMYLAAVSELSKLGERSEDGTMISLSIASDQRRKQTEVILRLLGWKLGQRDGSVTVEPGDQPEDSLRQTFPAAFEIDEIRMQETIESGGEFQFEIPTENARLAGGDDWSTLLNGVPVPAGGIAAVFATDMSLVKTCAGLNSMNDDAAAALLSAANLRTLATRYADPLSRHSGTFALSDKAVALPGGPQAGPVWQKLAGENPSNPGAFYRALLDKPVGTLAAFYSVLARADTAHQRFFTKDAARAERFYAWYQKGDEFRNGQSRQTEGWRSEFLQKAPLDDAGNIRYPGGKAAWTASAASDDDVLLGLTTLETMVPIAQLEHRRKRLFDEGSVKILARHYAEWNSLFPYFERFTDLSKAEFEALERFAGVAGDYPAATQNAVLGEWHSLVELISRGVQTGSIDQTAGTAAFRHTCEALITPGHSTKALAVLREVSGSGDLREAVVKNLLRLSDEHRAAFERLIKLQNVPQLNENSESQDPAAVATALSGLVYAASLDPDGLLVNADSRFLSKHQFLAEQENQKRPSMFAQVALVPSPSGAHMMGGLMNLGDVGKTLAPAGKSVARSAPRVTESGTDSGVLSSGTSALAEAPVEIDFKSTASEVSVWATVMDGRGKYVDDLTVRDFTILDQKNPQKIRGFESQGNQVSVVLLLDTTGSMQYALPALKNAALRLIEELRPEDSAAVYSFSNEVIERQPFTTDKTAAKRAVLTTQAMGDTALYDALARVGQDLTERVGKKAIVLFTDGKDNMSTLNPEAAIQRAKANGIPIYTIAQGEAIGHKDLLEQLAGISKATGGEAFAIEKPSEIGQVFDSVSKDLAHGYWLYFEPPAEATPGKRTIQVVVGGSRSRKVRAREEYYPD